MSGRICQAMIVAIVFATTSIGTTRHSTFADDAFAIANLPKNLFGGAEVSAQLAWRDMRPGQVRIVWSLEAVDHRAVKRGETDVPAGAQTVPIRMQLPPVKDGVILPLLFRASLIVAGQSMPEAAVEQKLWIFPESPWIDHQEILKRRKITLFDPKETTVKLFHAAGVPCEETRNVSALGELSEGLIVVGEGVDFREYPDLLAVLWSRAAAGHVVICLAPAAGTISLKSEAGRVTPSSLSFRREDVISELDPRLDVGFWRSAEPAAIRGLALRGEGSDPVLEVSDEKGTWPWSEARFGPGTGRLIFCCFDICNCWEKGPTARYLLSHLFMLGPYSQDPAENSEKVNR